MTGESIWKVRRGDAVISGIPEINCPVFGLSRAYSLGRSGGSGSFRIF